MFLSVIRPAKRHLIGLPWAEVAQTVWERPADDEYYFKKSHAVAYAMQLAKTMSPDQSILVNLSGRGDKDIGTVADLSGADFFCRPSCQGQSVKGGPTEHVIKVTT